MNSYTPRVLSSLPGAVVSLTLFSFTVLAWPVVLERYLSLDWRLGNMRLGAYGFQAFLFLLFIISLLTQRRINALYVKMFPTRRQLLFALATFLCSLAFSLIVLEIAFRLFHFPLMETKTPSENATAQFDDELGWAYIPNRFVVQQFGSDKREVAMYFDAIGSRVRSPGDHLDPHAPTLIFVGDSYTMGHGLPYEETFVGEIRSTPDFPFQVVNLGVQGYGTDQSLLLLERQFKKFNTKVVVYTFMADSVYRNANYDRRILGPRARILGTKPLFGLNNEGTLYLKKKPCRVEDYSYSRVAACVQVALARWGPIPPLDLTRALVKAMKEYVESNGATFVVVLWDHLWVKGTDSLFRNMNLNLVDTATSPPPGWENWRIPGDEHPDARAHRYVAQLVIEEFKRLHLIP